MNTQTAYNQMRAWFSAPGRTLAKTDEGACEYTLVDSQGRTQKCAVGAILPENMNDLTLMGGVDSIIYDNDIIAGYLWDVNLDFLREAQRLHDSYSKDTGAFVALLDVLARAYDLDTLGTLL